MKVHKHMNDLLQPPIPVDHLQASGSSMGENLLGPMQQTSQLNATGDNAMVQDRHLRVVIATMSACL